MARLTARPLALALCAAGAFSASPAWALFDDEEARRQIAELRKSSNERIETQSRAQLDLSNQIEALKAEMAKLRGQVETLTYELENTKKRQQDFYIDLDGRLRKFEPGGGTETKAGGDSAAAASGQAGPKKAADPAEEARAYEAALNLFKAGKYKDSAAAFDAFVKKHPDSDLAPSAQYWLGNSYYGLRDCKKAIEAQKTVVARWGSHAKAPDAMLNISTCQQEQGDAKGAKQTLEMLASKYPGTPSGDAAAKRLKKK
ncbi:MAG: tol-pal system protein YbgF [Betaproteobacteria bacterium]|uniref:Cell division coordinator CpoB n=1 Tax=Candidatus Proximibacter danicus TaxID=2954365 RepID=A0A9D7PRV1_9PROT|nr:tol-pal system protein YbgF [Candidatus Proximibacter danicus]MBK9447468.1 tol-pal system protein YbgF [Betaproteobacteria bacterium]